MTIDYPVCLHLAGIPCVVIGGGYGTERRVRDLLDAGARVTLIADMNAPELDRILDRMGTDRFRWWKRPYAPGDLADAMLVVSCPTGRACQRTIWQEAKTLGLFMNAVDDPAHGNFVFPAIHRSGDVTVAVSTAGKSPALAVRLRDRFAKALGPEFGVFLDLLGDLRQSVTEKITPFTRRLPLWRQLMECGALELVREGRTEAARDRLKAEIDLYAAHTGSGGDAGDGRSCIPWNRSEHGPAQGR